VDRWFGHDRPDDKRYHFDRPFEHGRFEHFGPSYRYRIERFDRDHHRFWLPGGFFFEVAAWDWPICADWCWDCADDFVIYEDSATSAGICSTTFTLACTSTSATWGPAHGVLHPSTSCVAFRCGHLRDASLSGTNHRSQILSCSVCRPRPSQAPQNQPVSP